MNEVIENSGIISENVEVIWTNSDPASAILNTSKKAGVDFLIK
ncbi:MAG: hypothetical protein Q7S39_03825 [Ignavibacteria bacterium]|nr:hypothetical protein [Ignavibacteria bacterium]